MNFIRERVLSGELLAGAWCNLSSAITVEVAALTGYDWVLIDHEHGPGDNLSLLQQLQALGMSSTAPIVRIAWNEMPRFKRALDLGAMGIMIPYVQSKDEAEYAVKSMQYAPTGYRGVASSPRATGFSLDFKSYHAQANDNLLTVVQIETETALENLEDIAEVDGVDVLFVGPLDLSISLGISDPFNNQQFFQVLKQVGQVAGNNGKAAGILLPHGELIQAVLPLGFSFIAAGSDGGMVVNGMKNTIGKFNELKSQ